MNKSYKGYRSALETLDLLYDDLAEIELDLAERVTPARLVLLDKLKSSIRMYEYGNELEKLGKRTSPAFAALTDDILNTNEKDPDTRLDMLKKYTKKFCRHNNIIVESTGSRSFDGGVTDDIESYTVCLDCGAENIDYGDDNGKDISDGSLGYF